MKRRWLALLIAVFAVTIGLEVFLADLGHAELPWHRVAGFDIAFGLGGCIAIIVGSKWLGKHFLQRSEDYYEKR